MTTLRPRRCTLKADLETRIADAIGAALPSKDIVDLLSEVRAADMAAKSASAAANERALDPATRPADVANARQAAEDADFRSQRMATAAERLSDELKSALAREQAEELKRFQDLVLADRSRPVF